MHCLQQILGYADNKRKTDLKMRAIRLISLVFKDILENISSGVYKYL